jgi:hypothetical protein
MVEFLFPFAMAFVVWLLRRSKYIFINSPTHLIHFDFELVPSFSKELNSIHCPDSFALHPIAKSLGETATHGLQYPKHLAIKRLKFVCHLGGRKCSVIPRLVANVRVFAERWTKQQSKIEWIGFDPGNCFGSRQDICETLRIWPSWKVSWREYSHLTRQLTLFDVRSLAFCDQKKRQLITSSRYAR